MPSSANTTFQLSIIDAVQVAVVCASALKQLNFRVHADDQLYRIIAERRDSRQSNFKWEFEYLVCVDWTSDDSITSVSITITENNYNQSKQQCQEYCQKLQAQILADQDKFLRVRSKRNKSTIYGASAWATHEQLLQAGYTIHRGYNRFTVIGVTGDRAELEDIYVVPEKHIDKHTIVTGPTGSGKTQGFFIPNLLMRLGESAIVTEATPLNYLPDLFSKTAGWRAAHGQKVFLFNPDSTHTHCFNPIDEVRKASPDQVKVSADALADLIIANTAGKGSRADPAFDRSEKLLLLSLILYVSLLKQQYAHMGSVRRLLRQGPDGVIKVLSKASDKSEPVKNAVDNWYEQVDIDLDSVTGKTRSMYFENAAQEFKAWYNNTREGFRYAVAGGLLSRLNPWLTNAAIAMTAKSDFDPSLLVDDLFSIYLSAPVGRPDLKLLTALLFSNFLNMVRRYKFQQPVSLFLDEFTNFGRIDGMHEILSVIRKAQIPICLGIQNTKQLEEVYTISQAEIIASQPATRIFYKPNTDHDTRRLSQMLGTMTYEEEKLLPAGNTIIDRRARALMTVDEIDNMKSDEIIVFAPEIGKALINRFPDGFFEKCWTKCALPGIPELKTESQEADQIGNSDASDTLKDAVAIAEKPHQDGGEDKLLDDVPLGMFEEM